MLPEAMPVMMHLRGLKPRVSNVSSGWSGENFTALMQTLQPLTDEAAVQKSGQILIQNKNK